MRCRLILIFISLAALFCATANGYCPGEAKGTKGSGSLKVGAAVVDITPLQHLNVDMAGYRSRLSKSKGVHDPVTCRCLVIDDSNAEMVIIALDFSYLPYRFFAKKVTPAIHYSTGIPEEHIFFHSTHTHSGPSFAFYAKNPEEYETLVKKITQCAQEAKKTKTLATANIASGVANVNTVNRQFPQRNVSNVLHVIEFRDLEQITIATLVNFACHPVVLGPDNLLISSDYIHYVRKGLEKQRKGISIFISGSLGDINPAPVNPNSNYRSWWNRTGETFEKAKILGQNLAQTADSLLNKSETKPISIRVISKEISLKGDINTKISIIDCQSFVIVAVPGEPTSGFEKMLRPLFPNNEQLYFGLTHDKFGYIMSKDDWMEIQVGIPLPDRGRGKDKNWAEDLFMEYKDLSSRLWPNTNT